MPVAVSATSSTNKMWRVINGKPEAFMTTQNDYVIPPTGAQVRLRMTGLSHEFEMTTQYGPRLSVRPEFQILKIAGNNQGLVGKKFQTLYTLSVREDSNLGKFLRRLHGGQLPVFKDAGGNIKDPMAWEYIDTEFTAFVEIVPGKKDPTKSYPNLPVGFIDPATVKLSPWIGSGMFDNVNEEMAEENAPSMQPTFAAGFDTDFTGGDFTNGTNGSSVDVDFDPAAPFEQDEFNSYDPAT
jgi:hypothetical protein